MSNTVRSMQAMPFLQQIPSPEYQAPNQPFERTPTSYFRYADAPAVGISLHDAFCNNLIGLENANEPVFAESGAKISYRIMWIHYAPFSKQKYATRTRNGACSPITRAKAARQIAQVVKEFIDKRASQDVSDSTWRVGSDGIDLKNIYLLELRHVSKASYQPILAVMRPGAVGGGV